MILAELSIKQNIKSNPEFPPKCCRFRNHKQAGLPCIFRTDQGTAFLFFEGPLTALIDHKRMPPHNGNTTRTFLAMIGVLAQMFQCLGYIVKDGTLMAEPKTMTDVLRFAAAAWSVRYLRYLPSAQFVLHRHLRLPKVRGHGQPHQSPD